MWLCTRGLKEMKRNGTVIRDHYRRFLSKPLASWQEMGWKMLGLEDLAKARDRRD